MISQEQWHPQVNELKLLKFVLNQWETTNYNFKINFPLK